MDNLTDGLSDPFDVVLFGAGASVGQAIQLGSHPGPPMVATLYQSLAERFPVWAEQAARFADEPTAFEARMDALLQEEAAAAEAHAGTRVSLTEDGRIRVPDFSYRVGDAQSPSTRLQWALSEFFFEFEPRADNLYERFCRRTAGAIRARSLRLASLNYDRLLLSVLANQGIAVDVGQEGAPPDSPFVCLPHGSAAFDCRAGLKSDGAQLGMKGHVTELTFAPLGMISNGPMLLFRNVDDLRAAAAQRHAPPSLSFIEPRKGGTHSAGAGDEQHTNRTSGTSPPDCARGPAFF